MVKKEKLMPHRKFAYLIQCKNVSNDLLGDGILQGGLY